MSNEASFYGLFRRSRYARDEEDESKFVSRQNRRELFAVEAVSFVVKHDMAFKREFLERIAGVPNASLNHRFLVESQKAYCADLLITDLNVGNSYVIEFKVDATIQKKQLPGTTEFQTPKGYLSEMLRRFGTKGLKKSLQAYTVLSKQREFDDKPIQGVECRSRSWGELIHFRKRSLTSDLLDTLGNFGISVLKLRDINGKKLSKFALGAFKVHRLLQAVATDFKVQPDTDFDEEYEWCGMTLTAGKQHHIDLRKWLGNHWRDLGWIGYLMPRGQRKTELSIWFYFNQSHSTNRATSVKGLRNVLKDRNIRASKSGCDIIISQDADLVSDDKDWFRETLSLALANIVPAPTSPKRI